MSYIDDLADKVRAEIPEALRPDRDAQALYRLYALLALVKGEHVTSENVHDAWAVWKSGRSPRHRSLVPFRELSPEVQDSDVPFVDAIRRVAREQLPTHRVQEGEAHDETARGR